MTTLPEHEARLRCPAARARWLLAPVLLAAALCGAWEDRPPIPPANVWNQVQAEPLTGFNLPQAERVTLKSGAVVFLLEDHELPLVGVNAVFRGGQLQDPDEKVGLASLMATVLRSGGSAALPGDRLDEALEDRAASIWTGADLESSYAGLSCLREDLDTVLAQFVDLLRKPAFPQEKLDLALTQARTAVARRNDQPTGIANREFMKVLYGRKGKSLSPYARHVEYETLNAIARVDLVEFHRAHIQPHGLILSAWGDFQRKELLERLERALDGWAAPAGGVPGLPDASVKRDPRLYFVERPKLNQTTLLLGHGLDIRRDSPEYPAFQYLNEVLSGGMSARLFTEVRTKKGLAYSVWGYARVFYNRPGLFTCGCMTRNEQLLDAVAAVREEVARLKEQGVTDREVEATRESLLNSFVFHYDSPDKILAQLRTCEFYAYPLDFDRRQFEALGRVTREDVDRVARKYLEPDKFTLLAVGGTGPSRPLATLGKVEYLDVTIPAPVQTPLVIDPEREVRGKKVLEAALIAAGGLKPFQEIKTLRTDVIFHTGPLRLKAILRIAVPDRVRADVAGPFGPLTQIVAGAQAWQASGTWVKATEPAEAQRNLRSLLQTDLGILRILAAGKEGYNIQALEPLRDGERMLAGVLLESATLGRIRVYFDERTKLMAKLRYLPDGQTREAEKTFTEHQAYGPLTLARRCEDTDPKARAKVIELLAVRVNPELDERIFAKPEQAAPPADEER